MRETNPIWPVGRGCGGRNVRNKPNLPGYGRFTTETQSSQRQCQAGDRDGFDSVYSEPLW
jgi:hypothetical protein